MYSGTVSSIAIVLVCAVPCWVAAAATAAAALMSWWGSRKASQQKRVPTKYTGADYGFGAGSDMSKWLETGYYPDQGPTTSSTSGSSSSSGFSNTVGQEKIKPTYHYGSQPTVEALIPFMNTLLGKGGTVTPAEEMGVVNRMARTTEQAKDASLDRLTSLGLGGSPQLRASVGSTTDQTLAQALSDYRSRIPEVSRARGIEGMNTVGQLLKALFQGSQKDFWSNTTTGSSSSSSSRTVSDAPPRFDPSGAMSWGVGPPGPQGTNWQSGLGKILSLFAAYQASKPGGPKKPTPVTPPSSIPPSIHV